MEHGKPSKYRFEELNGHVIGPGEGEFSSGLQFMYGTDRQLTDFTSSPQSAEQYIMLLAGTVLLRVDDQQVDLRQYELIKLNAGLRIVIESATDQFEYLGLKVLNTRTSSSGKRKKVKASGEMSREIRAKWGYRVPLRSRVNQNRWLIGQGNVRFPSDYFSLGYLQYESNVEANRDFGTRLYSHLHRRAWEYYVVLAGQETLEIENMSVVVNAGEICAVPPSFCHTPIARLAPFRSFTLRVPLILRDKYPCQKQK